MEDYDHLEQITDSIHRIQSAEKCYFRHLQDFSKFLPADNELLCEQNEESWFMNMKNLLTVTHPFILPVVDYFADESSIFSTVTESAELGTLQTYI
jgi:hypothetical protein